MGLNEDRTNDLRERVMRGVETLDMVKPEWWRKIDLNQLAMRDCQRCVLGQVFRTYAIGMRLIREKLYEQDVDQDYVEGSKLGFDYDDELVEYWNNQIEEFKEGEYIIDLNVWDEMGIIWADIITERQSA